MSRTSNRFMGGALALFGATALACSSSGGQVGSVDAALQEKEAQVAALEKALRAKESTLESQQSQIERLNRKLEGTQPDVAAAPPSSAPGVGTDLLPPTATPGSCYARVLLPAEFDTDSVRVLRREAGEKIQIVPARYEIAEEQILVKEASEKLVEVAAVYRVEKEKVLVKPAHTVWKKGRGPIERVDNATGEIMCLVDVPDQYETVSKRVLVTPASTKRLPIPAEYKTVRVRKMVEPPRESRVAIPAQYAEVKKRTKVSEERMEWQPVLCETNATRQLIVSVQRALGEAGHNPGPLDGVLGGQTLSAVRAYQRAKGLPTGGLTFSTLDSLGVKVGR